MTAREQLALIQSYRAAGGTGSYTSLLKEAKEYATGGPKSKLPSLPSYLNIQPTQDNIRMQYTPIDPIQRDAAEVAARKLRVAQREKELQEYYSQPGMISGMKRKPNPSEVKAHAEASVSYNDKLYNDPVGTLGPDIAMAVVPELLMMKTPQQVISSGLRYLNPIKKSTPWNMGTVDKIKDVIENPWKVNPFRFKPNPNAYYHRSKDIKNIINEDRGILQGFGQSEAGALFNETAGPMRGKINLKKEANNQLYFSKGVPLDYGRYNSIEKGMSGQGYKGPYLVETKDIPMGASVKGRRPSTSPPSNIEGYAVPYEPVPIDDATFYREHWLQGYKKIKNPISNK